MSRFLVAQNLNASSSSVAAALMGGDSGWLRDLAFRLASSGVDALDVCVSAASPAADTEIQLLDWAAQQVESVTELPLLLDSPRARVLESCRRRRRVAPILNSLSVEDWCSGALRLESEERCVIQLRRGQQLPRSSDDRLRWAEAALAAAMDRGIRAEHLFMDPVALAWGEDYGAGEALFEFLSEARQRWPGLALLVGVGNLSWGHAHRSRLEQEWLRRLVDRGANAFLLNAFDPRLIELARS